MLAYNTNQEAPHRHAPERVTATIDEQSSKMCTIQPRFWGEKVAASPPLKKRAGRPVDSPPLGVPVHARCCCRCHPRKQQTSTRERSAEPPSLLLPLRPCFKSLTTGEVQKGKDGLIINGFPSRGPRSCRRPLHEGGNEGRCPMSGGGTRGRSLGG